MKVTHQYNPCFHAQYFSVRCHTADTGVTTLASGLSWVDLLFRGRRHAIATVVAVGGGGVALIDPGPSTCLSTLTAGLARQALSFADVTHILLTHIHLDHAGATGTIVRSHPHIRVFVHERGAPHLIDPAKLRRSAAQLYGDSMDRLWGEFAAVPADNVEPLRGGERVEAAGRRFEVAYTPGHASHHVSYFDPSSSIAFAGDVAGVSVDGGYVLPPTPPPDIDLDAWAASVARLEAWSPTTLFLAHFGPVMDVRTHLQTLLEHLSRAASRVRASLQEPGTDEERTAAFAADLRRDMRRHMTDAQVDAYETAAPFEHLWLGLARYWRKKEGAAGGGGQLGQRS